ncbi:MAG TPA: bifunctional phosphoglucose/phosphomannose isomerase [Chloroflexota bacterium]|nr:bifunctional phosphoglucose/phosphomannose isomerase [Chloroflexota bacterium]
MAPAPGPGAAAVDLDRPETYTAVDAQGMLAHLEGLPAQLEAAWELVTAFDAPAALRGAEAIVVAGMGGSAIGADLVRGLCADQLGVPLLIWRDYGLPAFVGPRTLVIASSNSGGTEETLSAVERALAVGAPVVGITTGGRLAARLAAAGQPVLRFAYEGQPRAAIGYALLSVLGLLARLGYLPDQTAAVRAGIQVVREAVARFGPAAPTASNDAKRLALALRDRVAIIYGGDFLAPAARRWKGQCNENGKHWAVFEELPELNHNAVVGYEFPVAAADAQHVVLLCSELLPPRLELRCSVTKELLDRRGIPSTTVYTWGDGALAHLLAAVAFGDWTSYYLALSHGADPTSIGAIDYLKARLAEAD